MSSKSSSRHNVTVAWIIIGCVSGVEIYKTLRNLSVMMSITENGVMSCPIKILLERSDPETLGAIEEFQNDNEEAIELITSIDQNIEADLIGVIRAGDIVTCDFVAKVIATYMPNKSRCIFISSHEIEFGDNHCLNVIPRNVPEVHVLLDKRVYPYTRIFSQSAWRSWAVNARDISVSIGNLSVAEGSVRLVADTISFTRVSKYDNLLDWKVWYSNYLLNTQLNVPADIQNQHYEHCDGLPGLRSGHALRSFLSRHHTLEHYARTQYALHKAISVKILKRVLQKRQERVFAPLDMQDGRERIHQAGLSDEAILNWGDLNTIEPLIRASEDMLTYIPLNTVGIEPSILVKVFMRIKAIIGERQVTDLILVPHLVRGGADLTAINLARELSKDTSRQILVMATVDVESPWRSAIESISNATFIDLHNDMHGSLDHHQLIVVVMWVIKAHMIKRISVINSEVGYRLAADHRDFLDKLGSKLYIHTYAYDMTDDGFLYNVIPNGLVDAYPGVDMFVTDSKAYARQLCSINGFSKEKVTTLYQPIIMSVMSKKDYRRKNRVLWASRVSNSKLAEVMIVIGKLIGAYGIELHVFGALDPDYEKDDKFANLIAEVPSINYHGSYEGFSSINVNEYDIFLITTKNEGMPNVVLEACAANLFIVAPSVGGISECVTDGQNGIIVSDKFNPDEYVSAILRSYERGFDDVSTIQNACQKVLSRHTRESYEKSVLKLLGL